MATHSPSDSFALDEPRSFLPLHGDAYRRARFEIRRRASEVPSVLVMEPVHIRNRHHRIPSDDIDPMSPAFSGTTPIPDSSYTGEGIQGNTLVL